MKKILYFLLSVFLFSCSKENNDTIEVDNAVILDQLDNSTIGNSNGISYINTTSGKGAVFTRVNASRIEYPFSSGLPTEGTIELKVNINSGYTYNNYNLTENEMSANIFNCGLADVWYKGALLLSVANTGKISLQTALTSSSTYHTLIANVSNFRYNEWHIVSFSYGSKGQYIKIDGNLVASNTDYTEPMQACGNFSTSRDVPTVGQVNSVFWQPNRYDSGFEGIVDCFRASNVQQDWKLKL